MRPLPPNVLYLHSHDTGRHVRPYGRAVDTPVLQAFAESGATFRQAFCANPTCSPSRACLLSGRYAHSNGMMGLAHLGGRLARPGQTMPALLRSAGYDTALAGLQHVVGSGGDRAAELAEVGYNRLLFDEQPRRSPEHPANPDHAAMRAAADFLKSRRPGDKPFFLDAGFFATHRAATPGGDPTDEQWHNPSARPEGDPRYVAVPAPLPDTPEVRADVADFEAAVARLDRLHGGVLRALQEASLADRTVVVITTDHGPAFPHMKCNLTHHGTGVLLLMRGPGIPAGLVVDSLVSHIDLLPAVCELAGIDTPGWVQGRSLLHAFEAPSNPTSVRGEVFSEVNHHAAWEPARSVRTATFHYTRRLDAERPPHAVWPNIDDSPSKTLLHAAGVLDRRPPDESLFDLLADPQETCDIAGDPRCAGTLADLRRRMNAWMAETNDPALEGPPRVPGMRQQDKEAFHPAG